MTGLCWKLLICVNLVHSNDTAFFLHSIYPCFLQGLASILIALSSFSLLTLLLSHLVIFIPFLFIYRCYNMLYLIILLIFLVHFFRATRWGLTFPGDKPVPGVSSGIECPLNDMLRYALNDRTTLEMTIYFYHHNAPLRNSCRRQFMKT